MTRAQAQFVIKRLAGVFASAICLTMLVFYLTNLPPSLDKLARNQVHNRMAETEVSSWLARNGYDRPFLVRYGEWIGMWPGWSRVDDEGRVTGRCVRVAPPGGEVPRYCGVLQGDFGHSTLFNEPVTAFLPKRLALTGTLMFWVFALMIPTALTLGILAGMREGSRTDRAISIFSITTASTPEYVSGVVLITVFASSAVGLRWFKGSAASAMEAPTFENFFLPVLTIALYGVGYVARMTRASMADVMTSRYIQSARLAGLPFSRIVLRHALRNALITPFTVIMLQIPWLLTGNVVVETLFNYKGFGWSLFQAASNNDIELLMACSLVAVLLVLLTQFLSDIAYIYLNPRIRLT